MTEQKNKPNLRLEHANAATEDLERPFNVRETKIKCRPALFVQIFGFDHPPE
jgi:hypothetical protein